MVSDKISLALVEQMKTVLRKERAIDEITEVLDFNYRWLIQFCQTNRIEIPDKERLYKSLSKLRDLLNELYQSPNDSKQPNEPNEEDYRTLATNRLIALQICRASQKLADEGPYS